MKVRLSARFTSLYVTALSLLAAGAASAQEAAAAAGTGPQVTTRSVFKILQDGGLIMIPLAGFSIAMVWLIIDCAQRTGTKRLIPADDLEKLHNSFRAGDYVGAYQGTLENNSVINNVARVGLVTVGDGKSATEHSLTESIISEQAKISNRISYLSVIGVCTPMVGLLGTVFGMISAFEALGGGGATQNTGALAQAIGHVLVATASGLFVAIPAFMSFYFLRNRLMGGMNEVEAEIGNLFRKFPYHLAEGVHIGDQELYANAPNWVEGGSAELQGAPAV
ncbi:MAG: biopolymer transporter [Verrucomicrobiales bacterium]|nr:biopolymer transporter [Verrucomicrobiales bacterium]